MRVIRLTMCFITLGWLLFYAVADFSSPAWSAGYFLWDKGKDLLLLMTVAMITEKYRRLVLITVLFAFIRFVWEVLCLVFQADKNGQGPVNIMYGIVLFIFIYQLYLDATHYFKRTVN